MFVCFQRNRGILLGVVGTDVPVSELLKTIPKYKVYLHYFFFLQTITAFKVCSCDTLGYLPNDVIGFCPRAICEAALRERK